MKTKNHFDSEIDNASQSINTDSKEDRNALSHKNQEEDDASSDVLNLSIQILLKVELMKELKSGV